MKPIDALKHINEIVSSFLISQTFFTACKLGVFEALADGPATPEDLARRLEIHPEGSRRLLAALRQLGLVENERDQWRNSEAGDSLTSKASIALEPISEWSDFYHFWEFMPDALRELAPQWQRAFGTSSADTFSALYEDPVRLRRFAGNMSAYSAPLGEEIAERFDFTCYHCVLDVAGGPGAMAIQIGRKHPHLRGIIMDLPPVCRVADEYIRAAGLTDRFSSASADLFEGPYPFGADVITLSWILHDWSDDNCRKILRNCFAALPVDGALLISESVLNNDLSGSRFAVLMSLHMTLVCETGARERSEQEYRSLLEEAGFRDMEVIRFGAPRDLVVARKG